MRKILFKYILFTLFFTVLLGQVNVFANTADLDPRFDTKIPIGFDNTIYDINIQSNGKIIVGGAFGSYQGVSSNKIIRLNSDGTKDSSFSVGGGFGSTVLSIKTQTDGKIIAGGIFTSYSGVTANRIIRLNSDGSRDSSFSIGNGFNSYAQIIAIQNDGKILIGGDFTSYSGATANRIIRLNSNGTRDSSFSIGSGFNGTIYSIMVQSDNKILIGGDFTNYNGTSVNRIIRLNADGTRDSSFSIGSGFNNMVRSIVSDLNGKYILGGFFTGFNGTTANRIIRLNTDGSIDTSFSHGAGFNSNVITIRLQSDGKLLIGGEFTSYQGVGINRLIRLNSNGTKDTSFAAGLTLFDNSVTSLELQSNGKILAGGVFTTYGTGTPVKLIRINTDGQQDTSFFLGNGFNKEINYITIQNDKKVLLGGTFTTYNGSIANRIIRLNPDGSRDASFAIGNGFNSTINSIVLQSDNKILIGGLFTSYSGTSRNRLIRLSLTGAIDNTFVIGGGFNDYIQSMLLQSDGKILVGGNFSTYSGATVNKIARLNTNGSRDTSFNIGTGFNNTVNAIGIQSDGKILVGGFFTNYNGASVNRIVRLNPDGTRDTSFTMGTGFNNTINTISIQNDGKILVGGFFTNYNGASVNRIVRLNPDGTRDTSFTIGSGPDNTVYSIKYQSNGKILVGGSFSFYSGAIAKRIVVLQNNGTIDTGFYVPSGFDNTVYSIETNSDGKIFVGGLFRSYNNVAAGFLTSLYGDSNFVILPNSNNCTDIKNQFLGKGYAESTQGLEGSTPISLTETDGKILKSLTITNENINLSLPSNIQFKQANGVSNYNGIISVPTNKPVDTINDEQSISAFKVGSTSESIKLTGGVATIFVPAPGKNIGDLVQISYSEDNGVTRYPQIKTLVVEHNGQPYASFTTNHFTDFAVTNTQGSFSGSFVINNDAQYTNTTGVSLKITTTQNPTHMRFSNDGFSRSNWIPYSNNTARNLTNTTGNQTVYLELDVNNDSVTDIAVNDSIAYNPNITVGGTTVQATLGITTGTLAFYKDTTGGNHSSTLDIGTYAASFSAINASSAANHRFEIHDMLGLPFIVTLQASPLTASNGSIPAGNIGYQGTTWTGVGAALTATPTSAVDIGSSPVTFVARNNSLGLSKYHQDITLQVLVPAAQAPGNYTGVLTFTY